MTRKEILQQSATECLRAMISAHLMEDFEKLQLFTDLYCDVLQDMHELNMRNNACITDAQFNYVFNSDMQVDANGKLISTPEH